MTTRHLYRKLLRDLAVPRNSEDALAILTVRPCNDSTDQQLMSREHTKFALRFCFADLV
jgi:hypothetical protein